MTDTVTLVDGLEQLDVAVNLAAGKLPGRATDEAAALLERARGRQAQGLEHTVVAFAGATGSGKSSLLNAFAAHDVAEATMRRPTTSEALAVSRGQSSALLAWMGVENQHTVEDLPEDGGNLVLLDLPDIDSTEEDNRRQAEYLVARSDVIVWVLDPQKYADAVIHEDFLRAQVEHSAVLLVVLNQIDRIDPAEVPGVLSDAQKLVQADGVTVEVLATSAATGEGIDELRERVFAVARTRTAAAQRLAADLRTAGTQLRDAVYEQGGEEPGAAQEPNFAEAGAAIARASGSDIVVEAAARSYELRAKRATSWPLKALWHLRAEDPLARLHLRRRTTESGITPVTSLATSPVLAVGARGAVQRYAEEAVSSMPRVWRERVAESAVASAQDFRGAADEVLARADLEEKRRPLWWLVLGAMQWLAFLAMLFGLVWFLGLWLVDVLHIRLPEPPYAGIFPLPLLLAVGGLLLGIVLSLMAGALIDRGRDRLRERVTKRLSAGISQQAEENVLQPITQAREQYATFWNCVESLRRVRATGESD